MKLALLLSCLLVACGTPTPSNNTDSDAGPNNATDTAVNNVSTSGTSMQTTGTECAGVGQQFIDAVRALGRSCVTSADCKVAPRANQCDCDLAVSASADTTEFESLRADLDAAQCSNPFGCAGGTCPYKKLSEPGELVAHCGDDGECEMVQVMPCSEYEARAHGGIVPAGSCTDSTQCVIRADLNPCGCGEAISTNFPLLTTQATADLIAINDARCNVSCMGCNSPGAAVCGDDGSGNMICMTQ